MTQQHRQGAVYRRLSEVARTATTCYLCGRPIDHTLTKDKAASASADHHTPMSLGGDVHGPMYGAHRVCNMRRYNHPITDALKRRLASLPLEYDTQPKKRTPLHSQTW